MSCNSPQGIEKSKHSVPMWDQGNPALAPRRSRGQQRGETEESGPARPVVLESGGQVSQPWFPIELPETLEIQMPTTSQAN